MISELNQPAAHNLVSVVVSTHNRVEKLPNNIRSLLGMSVPAGITLELICVDNNSTDNTKSVIEELARSSPVPLVYVFEAGKGASRARNAGLRHARGELIAITDDDCIADVDWLDAIWKEFEADPTLDVLGGRVELYNKDDLPLTIRTFKNRINYTPAALFSLIPGCNLAFRRRVITEIGGFDPNFGPGETLPSAEDSDFIFRAYKAGCKIAYSPDPLVHHDHGRRTELDRHKLNRSYVIGRGAFYMKHMLCGDSCVSRMAYWESISLTKGFMKNVMARRSDGDELKFLGYLMRGALLYLWVCIRKAVR